MNKKYKFDEILGFVELQDCMCELKHFPAERQKAVNFLCQDFGDFKIRVPICQECKDGLSDDDWVLLYCVTCASSQWVYLPKSKKPYLYKLGESIKWMHECPECHKKKGG